MSSLLYNGDCLEVMKQIDDKSIDMVLCDPPYGTTRNKWDIVIDLTKFFEQINRVIKDEGAIVLFSQMPFTVDLINANRKYFRYEWIWEKPSATGFLNAKKMPLKAHENVVVFYKTLPIYNPQFTEGSQVAVKSAHSYTKNYGKYILHNYNSHGRRFPRDVLKIKTESQYKKFNATQKPVPLMEYFIKTYTNEGMTVLDPTMGAGTTGVACKNLNRNFIGIEKDEEMYRYAYFRVNNTVLD